MRVSMGRYLDNPTMNSPLLAQRDRTAGFTLLELLITVTPILL